LIDGWGVRGVLQKKNAEGINNKLQLVMKSGKYTLGYKTVLKTLRNSKGSSLIRFLVTALASFVHQSSLVHIV
jgi:ribosomal protein L30E